MKCPHCLREVNPCFQKDDILTDLEKPRHVYYVSRMVCPNPKCGKAIIYLGRMNISDHSGKKEWMVFPKTISRDPVSPEVDAEVAKDYIEACLVFEDSPKASAALSRRCLQNILRLKAKVNPSSLSNEIQQVIDSKTLPSYLSENIDAIRIIGNFAAHPIKSNSSGEIVDVEPGEAEWLLDVIESLFDFYYVLPAKSKAKRDALNQKLNDLGKPKMK